MLSNHDSFFFVGHALPVLRLVSSVNCWSSVLTRVLSTQEVLCVILLNNNIIFRLRVTTRAKVLG